mgnify:CR=1 FL=1
MEIDLALLADAATVDAAGKLNILGIFDRISARSFPVRHPRLALVLRFRATMNEAGDHAVKILLSDPDGKEVLPVNGTIKIGLGHPAAGGLVRVPQVINLDGVPFEKPGRYAFDVSVDGDHKVSVPLYLHDADTKASVAQA